MLIARRSERMFVKFLIELYVAASYEYQKRSFDSKRKKSHHHKEATNTITIIVPISLCQPV